MSKHTVHTFFFAAAIMIVLAAVGCGAPKKQVLAPDPGFSLHIVGDWDQYPEELIISAEKLGHADKAVVILYPDKGTPPVDFVNDLPMKTGIQKKYFGREMGVVLIDLPAGQTIIPFNDLPQDSRSAPLIAILKGNLTGKHFKEIERFLSPDAYVIIGGHYAHIEDINGKPAYTTGAGDGHFPFAGDFKHVLKITNNKAGLSVRPMDADGYVLKEDIVTAESLRKLNNLRKAFMPELRIEQKQNVREYKVPAAFEIKNPFQATLRIKLALQKGNAAWQADLDETLEIRAGDESRIETEFKLIGFERAEPAPVIQLEITVGRRAALKETIKLPLKAIPLPRRE